MAATYSPPTLGQSLSSALAEARLRFVNISRYPGQLVLEIIIPIVFAAMPMLLGRATAGAQAGANFEANTGTANYVAFLLIGSNVFTIVSNAFWHMAYWLRFEQETGTLESIYLTQTSSVTLAVGLSIYSAVRAVITASVSYIAGCLVFRVNPFQGDVLLACAFIAVGLIPVYAVALLFGALVLKVKESNALIGLMQWVVSFLMGIFFPVAVLPPVARWVALAFPPTWMTNGARSALLGVGFFFDKWYWDMGVLWAFLLFTPLFSFWVFNRVENGVKRNEGMGQF
ncbi:MAG: ABC transporter permease [Chloroflexi bacterium]|nr:ABC transporter permease [Chloroflexota bacterium]